MPPAVASPSHGGGHRFESDSAYQFIPLTPLRLRRPSGVSFFDSTFQVFARVFAESQSGPSRSSFSQRSRQLLRRSVMQRPCRSDHDRWPHRPGPGNREIGERLFVSENTVKAHSSRLFEKMQVNRRVQAVQKGKDLGLIP
jgi:hypothetical protein